jgi:hypothetical protein
MEPWVKRLGVSTVEKFRRIRQRLNNGNWQKVLVVPMMNDTDDVVSKMTACFESQAHGFKPLGQALEEDLIIQAWHTTLIFAHRAAVYRWRSDILYMVSIFFLVSAGFFGSLAGFGALQWVDLTAEVFHLVSTIMLAVLPLMAMATTLRQRLYLERWSQLHFAAHSIVSEIYKYRLGVGPYQEAPIQALNREELFAQQHLRIRRSAMQTSCRDDLKPPKSLGATAPKQGTKDYNMFLVQVEHFVRFKLLNGGITGVKKSSSEYLFDDKNADKLVGQMPLEAYIEQRLKGLIMGFQRQLRTLAWRQYVFSMLTALAYVSCGCLAGFSLRRPQLGLTIFLPSAAILAVVLSDLGKRQMLQQRCTVVGDSVQRLMDTQQYMERFRGSSKIDLSTKDFCVNVVEHCCFGPVSAWTGIY